MSKELLTVSQVAEYLQISEKTVRRLITNGEIKASKVGGRSWRIKEHDIEQYLNANTNEKEKS